MLARLTALTVSKGLTICHYTLLKSNVLKVLKGQLLSENICNRRLLDDWGEGGVYFNAEATLGFNFAWGPGGPE